MGLNIPWNTPHEHLMNTSWTPHFQAYFNEFTLQNLQFLHSLCTFFHKQGLFQCIAAVLSKLWVDLSAIPFWKESLRSEDVSLCKSVKHASGMSYMRTTLQSSEIFKVRNSQIPIGEGWRVEKNGVWSTRGLLKMKDWIHVIINSNSMQQTQSGRQEVEFLQSASHARPLSITLNL